MSGFTWLKDKCDSKCIHKFYLLYKQTPGLTIQQHKARGITANRYGKPGSW